MQRNSLYSFVFFGTAFRYLSDLRGAHVYRGPGGPRDNIVFILEFLGQNNMRVSLNAAYSLAALLDEIDEKAGSPEYVLLDEDRSRVCAAIQNMRTTVLAESENVTAFFPGEKRYNVDRLFDDIGAIVGRQSFLAMPENAQLDFAEGGKCILLERGTAAVFHFMRGSEAVIKQLYLSIIKEGRVDLMWGPMAQHLIDRQEINESTKGILDIFRRGFRNPTAHPDTFYSIDAAQDVLGTSSQLVNLIITHPLYDRTAI